MQDVRSYGIDRLRPHYPPTDQTAGGAPVDQEIERLNKHLDAITVKAATTSQLVQLADRLVQRGIVALNEDDLPCAVVAFERSLISVIHAASCLERAAGSAPLEARESAYREQAELLLHQLPGRIQNAALLIRAAERRSRERGSLTESTRRCVQLYLDSTGVVVSLLGSSQSQIFAGWLRVAFIGDTTLTDVKTDHQHVNVTPASSAHPSPPRSNSAAGAPFPGLSPREQEVLTLIVKGETTSGIAYRLGVKASTIATLVGRIFDKLGVNNRPSAVAMALRYGLCD